jgi:hypothetical protein
VEASRNIYDCDIRAARTMNLEVDNRPGRLEYSSSTNCAARNIHKCKFKLVGIVVCSIGRDSEINESKTLIAYDWLEWGREPIDMPHHQRVKTRGFAEIDRRQVDLVCSPFGDLLRDQIDGIEKLEKHWVSTLSLALQYSKRLVRRAALEGE